MVKIASFCSHTVTLSPHHDYVRRTKSLLYSYICEWIWLFASDKDKQDSLEFCVQFQNHVRTYSNKITSCFLVSGQRWSAAILSILVLCRLSHLWCKAHSQIVTGFTRQTHTRASCTHTHTVQWQQSAIEHAVFNYLSNILAFNLCMNIFANTTTMTMTMMNECTALTLSHHFTFSHFDETPGLARPHSDRFVVRSLLFITLN